MTYSDLFSGAAPAAPVDNIAGFAFPANAATPSNTFEGTLTINNTATGGNYHIVSESPGYGTVPELHLAPFSFQFVQSGNSFIPEQQGLTITGATGAVWNYIIGPGKAWQESTDNGYTRVSFPFALVERNQNCVHNGEITFLFSNTLSPNISNAFYQVTQETCAHFKIDLWGQLPATYTPGMVANDQALVSAAAAEVSNRLPTKPFGALATDFSGSGIDVTAFTKAFVSPQDITVYGLMVNGTNYVSNCQTRYGNYANCGEMRLPSYSVAKSAFAGTALMRLGQLYSSSVYAQLIKAWVPQYVDGGIWTSVTFDQASKMATGNYINPGYMVDENSNEEVAFLGTEDFLTKITRAFAPFPSKAIPGTLWVYQTHATFILTTAMQAYLQQQLGSGADIFNLVRNDVFIPIKVSQGGLTTLRTDNSPTGHAIGGYGLFFIPDDIAKIGDFLNNGLGMIAGNQVLDNVRLQESLFRASNPATIATLGLPVPDTGSPRVPNTFRYNNNFWVKHFTPAEFPQYSCDFWVPYMSGFGGITVLLLPDGLTYYIFSDGNEFLWYDAVNEINKIKPFCH